MAISKEYSTNLRMLLPEVIWLEPEHFQQASKISGKIENEARQWQTYISILARSALSQWFEEKIADKSINVKPNITESVSCIKLDGFRISIIATEHLLDEVVNISRIAIERPELAAHFYALVEVDEEQEQAVLRGFLRYDELSAHCQKIVKVEDDCYHIPLSLFDAEPNHLLFYLSHLEPSAISLPSLSAQSTVDSLKQSFDSNRTKLSLWLQGVLEEGWLSFEELVAPEANLALNMRGISETMRKGKLINLGMQLENRAVALIITITSEIDDKIGILVQLYPTGKEKYLPNNLQLTLLNKAEKILQSTRSRSQDNYIQLKSFKGKPGTRFGIEVTMGDVCVKEDFEL